MSDDDKSVWFPAKLYGWGWGFPVVWQGWLVILVYVALLTGGSIILLPDRPEAFYSLLAIITIGLIAVCWLKGERPRWRWGED